jgi:hypothetical protein
MDEDDARKRWLDILLTESKFLEGGGGGSMLYCCLIWVREDRQFGFWDF